MISASECISKPAPSRPPSASPNSLDHGLQVHHQTPYITASKCLSNLAWLQPPSVSPKLLQYGLAVHTITDCNCLSPHSLDHGLSVYFETRLMTPSKCISKLAWLRPPSSHDHALPVHFETHLITASKSISELTGSSVSGAPWIALKQCLQPIQIYRVLMGSNIDAEKRIQSENMNFKYRWTISSGYDFQAHWQRSQRIYCFSQNALLWFEVLPDLSSVLPVMSSALADFTPRLAVCAPRCSLVHPKFSPVLWCVSKLITLTPMVLLYQSSEIPVTLKASQNALLGYDTLLKLTHLSLHSTSSQTLLETPSD